MKSLALFVAFLLFPLTAAAAEMVKGSNFMVVEAQNWQTGEGAGFWMMNTTGVTQYAMGPFGMGAVECHGAGFWDAEGARGEGICVHSDAEGTRTSSWERKKGEEFGHWKMTGGTGKFEGITGQGTYKPTNLPGGRVVSEFEGEVTLP